MLKLYVDTNKVSKDESSRLSRHDAIFTGLYSILNSKEGRSMEIGRADGLIFRMILRHFNLLRRIKPITFKEIYEKFRLKAEKFKLVMEFKEINYCGVPHGDHFTFRKKILLFTVEMMLIKN